MPQGQANDDQIESTIILELLNNIEEDCAVTQRSLAHGLGIALGLTNTYLKRCVKKGLVKIQHVPANRYAYYLTPQGFAEKSRLTTEYLSQGFQFFRMARMDIEAVFNDCKFHGYDRIALHGLTDLAEIAVLCSTDIGIQVIGIVDTDTQITEYAGIPVVTVVDMLVDLHAIVVTSLGNPQSAYDQLTCGLTPVLAPRLLKVRRADEEGGS